MNYETNINENYPEAGINQPSQGFRDNFLNIKLALLDMRDTLEGQLAVPLTLTGDIQGSGTISGGIITTLTNITTQDTTGGQNVFLQVTKDTKGRITNIVAIPRTTNNPGNYNSQVTRQPITNTITSFTIPEIQTNGYGEIIGYQDETISIQLTGHPGPTSGVLISSNGVSDWLPAGTTDQVLTVSSTGQIVWANGGGSGSSNLSAGTGIQISGGIISLDIWNAPTTTQRAGSIYQQTTSSKTRISWTDIEADFDQRYLRTVSQDIAPQLSAPLNINNYGLINTGDITGTNLAIKGRLWPATGNSGQILRILPTGHLTFQDLPVAGIQVGDGLDITALGSGIQNITLDLDELTLDSGSPDYIIGTKSGQTRKYIKEIFSLIQPGVIHVNKAGSNTGTGVLDNPYLTIQAGINAATNTVLIWEGTYTENITIPSMIKIQTIGKVTINGTVTLNGSCDIQDLTITGNVTQDDDLVAVFNNVVLNTATMAGETTFRNVQVNQLTVTLDTHVWDDCQIGTLTHTGGTIELRNSKITTSLNSTSNTGKLTLWNVDFRLTTSTWATFTKSGNCELELHGVNGQIPDLLTTPLSQMGSRIEQVQNVKYTISGNQTIEMKSQIDITMTGSNNKTITLRPPVTTGNQVIETTVFLYNQGSGTTTWAVTSGTILWDSSPTQPAGPMTNKRQLWAFQYYVDRNIWLANRIWNEY